MEVNESVRNQNPVYSELKQAVYQNVNKNPLNIKNRNVVLGFHTIVFHFPGVSVGLGDVWWGYNVRKIFLWG